ncbi:MAG: GntR family transcriptional regulator [Terracidiphilus sp.]
MSKKKVRPAPNSSAKAERGTSVTTAFRKIRELIVKGQLSPGSWLLESDLCEHLHMSRTPVRGAFHQLQREGYVLEHRNGSKSRRSVAPLTLADAGELYAIIGRIEGLAGRRAAALPAARREKLAAQLEHVNGRLKDIARNRQLAGASIFDLDREFHHLVVSAGAGPRLKRLHEAIEPQTERYWRLYASSILGNLHLSVAEHEEIIAALRLGDAARLDAALETNWSNGLQRLAGVIEIFGERGNW